MATQIDKARAYETTRTLCEGFWAAKKADTIFCGLPALVKQ